LQAPDINARGEIHDLYTGSPLPGIDPGALDLYSVGFRRSAIRECPYDKQGMARFIAVVRCMSGPFI
jgi:hypothetical protein